MTELKAAGPYIIKVVAPGQYEFFRKEYDRLEGAVEDIPGYGLAVLPEGEEREMTHGVPSLEAAAFYLAGYWNGRAYYEATDYSSDDSAAEAAHRLHGLIEAHESAKHSVRATALVCARCDRKRKRSQLMVTQSNQLACSQEDTAGYDECMTLWNASQRP